MRGSAGERYIAEARGVVDKGGDMPAQRKTETPLGDRFHDVRDPNVYRGTFRYEVKNYKVYLTNKKGATYRNSVPLSQEHRVQVQKDTLWIREGRKLGIRRMIQWEFLGAPPSATLRALLLHHGINFVVGSID